MSTWQKLSESRKDENNPLTKLSWEQVREIRGSYKTGLYSQNNIANQFNVTRSCVQVIVENRSWKETN